MEISKKNVIKWLCVAGVTLTFVLVSVLFYQFVRIGNLSKEKARLDAKLVEITEQADNYQTQVENMQDYNYLEDYARESGWAQNGDIKFV